MPEPGFIGLRRAENVSLAAAADPRRGAVSRRGVSELPVLWTRGSSIIILHRPTNRHSTISKSGVSPAEAGNGDIPFPLMACFWSDDCGTADR